MIRIGHLTTLIYGTMFPVHPGKWRVLSLMIAICKLRRACTVTARRRGVLFQLDLSSYLDVRLFYAGYYDYLETRFLEANLKPGDVFLDVGANIGYYTLLAARVVAPGGQVHAFEISSHEFDKLNTNVSLNKCTSFIYLNRTAVSNVSGELTITPTFGAGTTHIDVNAQYSGDSVPAITLDQYVKDRNLNKVNFLKCDIEGAELQMLKGAKALLTAFRPTVLIEVNPKVLARFGASVGDVLSELEDHDYCLYLLTKSPFGLGLRKLAKKDEPMGSSFINVVALPRERVSPNRDRLPLRLEGF